MTKIIIFITYIFLEFLMLLDDFSYIFHVSNLVKSNLRGGAYFDGKGLN